MSVHLLPEPEATLVVAKSIELFHSAYNIHTKNEYYNWNKTIEIRLKFPESEWSSLNIGNQNQNNVREQPWI